MSLGTPLSGNVKLRTDLQIRKSQAAPGEVWTIQDPVSLRTYQLSAEEWFIARLLQQGRRPKDIQRAFAAAFAPKRLTQGALKKFLWMLESEGLVIPAEARDWASLVTRHRENFRWRLWSRLNLLSIRFPGIQPQRGLTALYRRTNWIFSRTFQRLYVLVVGSALVLGIAEIGQADIAAVSWQYWANTRHLGLLVVAIAISKCLHELGHGLTCVHFGARCREMGVMLLAFIPCLYCDVSDTWLLPDRRKRVAIAAAGILTEIFVASVAFWVWRTNDPGIMKEVSLAIAITCSISSLVINGNPFLKFDGYYILSDVLGIPNLQQVSCQALLRCLGLRTASAIRELQGRSISWVVGLALYRVLSIAYQLAILYLVLSAIYYVFQPIGLGTLGLFVVGVVIVALASVPIMHSWKATRVQTGPFSEVCFTRYARPVLISGAVVATCSMLPFQSSIRVPVEVKWADAAKLYVGTPGTLIYTVNDGCAVNAGETIAILRNPTAEHELLRASSQVDEQKLLVRQLQLLESMGMEAKALVSAETALEQAKARYQILAEKYESLKIGAPISGTVLSGDLPSPSSGMERFDSTQLVLLDLENQGAFLATGTYLCSIGDPHRLEAIALLSDEERKCVEVGQRVRLLLRQDETRVFDGEVVQVSFDQIDLADDQPDILPSVVSPSRYMARIRFLTPRVDILPDSRGIARIYVDRKSYLSSFIEFVRFHASRFW